MCVSSFPGPRASRQKAACVSCAFQPPSSPALRATLRRVPSKCAQPLPSARMLRRCWIACSPAVHQYLLLDAMILDQAQRTSAEKESSLTSSDPKDVKLLFDSARDACNLDPGEVDSTIGRVARLRGIEANAEQSRADTCGCSAL